MSEAVTWSWQRRRTFLAALRETGNVSASAAKAERSRSSAYQLRKRNPKFAAAWEDALAGFLDDLEAELFRRAVEGSEKPVYFGGEKRGTVRNYSDALGMFLLRARRPDVFGERAARAEAGEDEAALSPLALIEQRLAKLKG